MGTPVVQAAIVGVINDSNNNNNDDNNNKHTNLSKIMLIRACFRYIFFYSPFSECFEFSLPTTVDLNFLAETDKVKSPAIEGDRLIEITSK